MSPKTRTRLKRFTPIQRAFHLVLMLTFLFQAFNGLGRMYYETPWGKALVWPFGDYDGARTAHVYVGIFMLCVFLLHTVYMATRVNWRSFPQSLFDPDSLVPHPRDIRQFFQHVGWHFGLKKSPPEFDRWGYWEKFDYWAVYWGMVIIGVTGLIMAFEFAATRFMPGWVLNVAFWVHRIEAMLAMAHIFIIHFFIGHLRRHNFPMDRAMFEGSVDFDAVRHERPAWIARLEGSGKLEGAVVAEAGSGLKTVYYLFGYTAMAVGVFLLIGALVNSGRITW